MTYINKFWKYRELLNQFVARDLKVKYRRSVLGYLWSLLNPLLMMIVLTAVFSSFFKFDIPNFPLYLITGQVVFSFFSEATSVAMTSIIYSGSLINKVYIPKYMFPLSKVISTFVTMLFSLIALVIVMIFTKTEFTWNLLMLPLPMLYLFLFTVGFSLITSVLAVFFRDMMHLYTVLLTVWMYFTPIFYPIAILPESVKNLILYNPIYYYVEYFRQLILYGQMPTLELNLICIGISIASLFIGLITFKANQNKFFLHI